MVGGVGGVAYDEKETSCVDMLRQNKRLNCESKLLLLQRERDVKSPSRVWLFATPWTVAYQAPLSMGFF